MGKVASRMVATESQVWWVSSKLFRQYFLVKLISFDTFSEVGRQ